MLLLLFNKCLGLFTDNLLKAKRKCRLAEHTSDLNSEVDNLLHKKSRRKKSESSSDCESEPEVEVEAPSSLTKKRKAPSPGKDPTSSLKKTSNKVVDEVKKLRKGMLFILVNSKT